MHDHGQAGRTVVMTTHDLAEARVSDHVVLVSGEVIASGPPQVVCQRENLERAYGLGALHDAATPFVDDPSGHDIGAATRHDPRCG